MGLLYFEQEAKKSKVSINVKQRISKATGIKYFLCSLVWYSFHHVRISESSIVRTRMEYSKKGGFSMPRKRQTKDTFVV